MHARRSLSHGPSPLSCAVTSLTAPSPLSHAEFFDCVFIYTFFSLRTFTEDVGNYWLLQMAMLQINTVLRNSGTYVALGNLALQRLTKKLLGPSHAAPPVAQDPLLQLQFLARIAIQYDLADVAALVLVPTLVTLCVARDGYFSLQVRPLPRLAWLCWAGRDCAGLAD
jgi:hypothetical protein